MAQICDLPFTRSHLDTQSASRAFSPTSHYTLPQIARFIGVDTAQAQQWVEEFDLLPTRRSADHQRFFTAQDAQYIFKIKQLICDDKIPPMYVAHVARTLGLIPAAPNPMAPPTSTQPFLSTIKAIAEQCAGPRAHAVAERGAPPVIADIIVLARNLFGAAGVQCWLAQPDGAWDVIGSPSGALGCEREARKLTARVVQHNKAYTTTVAKMMTLTAIPLGTSGDILGALLIARMASQRLTQDEKVTATIIAAQITQTLYAVRACLNERATAESWLAILNALPDAVMIRNKEQRIVFYNQAALDLATNRDAILAARAAGFALPRPEWDTKMPDGSEPRREDLASVRALAEDRLISNIHMTMRVPGRSQPAPILVSAAPLPWGADEVLSVVIVQDISSAKDIEKMKDNFVQSACHDMNGPISVMVLAAGMINKNTQQLLDAQDENFASPNHDKFVGMLRDAAKIKQSIQTIRRILADLKALPEAVLGPPSRMSLVDHVDMRVQEMQAVYGKHRFVLNLFASDTRLEGYWYRRDIESLVNNLLQNAVKYSPPDTTILVELRQEVTENNQRMARLIVKDRGYGLAEEELDRIFEKHARATTTDDQGAAIEGSGLGLHFCRQLVKLYNGFLSAKSAGRNQGSEFHLRLPLAEEE